MGVEYAQTSDTLQTDLGEFTPIPGLTITLPEGDDMSALVILSLPNPYAVGTNFAGGTIGIAVDGHMLPVVAAFTYCEAEVTSPGRIPTTLVVAVPLIVQEQTVQAMWYAVRGSKVVIDTPATLSATY